MRNLQVAFFGTDGKNPGHYWWKPGRENPVMDGTQPGFGPLPNVDGQFLSGGFVLNTSVKEFDPHLTVVSGVTVVQWVDYSGDRRGGSNGGLFAWGAHSLEDMLSAGEVLFPWASPRFREVRRVAGLG